MLIRYQEITLGAAHQEIVDLANDIVEEYARADIELTLRALYYRFVSRFPLALDPTGEHPNTQANYKRLGSILNRARLGGFMSWEAMKDITRNLETLNHWTSPAQILRAVRDQYREDQWAGQPTRVEMWIEKDAGVGTIKGVCERNDIPYFSCRGNCSQSEMWEAGQRLQRRQDQEGVDTIILYGGDHDPKGVDMTRDVRDRLSMFVGDDVEVRRIFLNIDQVRLYDPPPNPLKEGDSTAGKYREEFGDEAWELDALDPKVIADLIQAEIDTIVDPEPWQAAKDKMAAQKAKLGRMIDSFDDGDDDAEEEDED